VTVDTRLVIDGDEETLLRVPVLYKRGSVMLPIEFVGRVLVPRLSGGARFDRAQLELVTGPSRADVTARDREPTPDGARVRPHVSKPLAYEAETTSKQMVRVRISDERIDPVTLAADRPAPLVRSVRAEQRGRDAALYFELDGQVAGFRRSTED